MSPRRRPCARSPSATPKPTATGSMSTTLSCAHDRLRHETGLPLQDHAQATTRLPTVGHRPITSNSTVPILPEANLRAPMPAPVLPRNAIPSSTHDTPRLFRNRWPVRARGSTPAGCRCRHTPSASRPVIVSRASARRRVGTHYEVSRSVMHACYLAEIISGSARLTIQRQRNHAEAGTGNQRVKMTTSVHADPSLRGLDLGTPCRWSGRSAAAYRLITHADR